MSELRGTIKKCVWFMSNIFSCVWFNQMSSQKIKGQMQETGKEDGMQHFLGEKFVFMLAAKDIAQTLVLGIRVNVPQGIKRSIKWFI